MGSTISLFVPVKENGHELYVVDTMQYAVEAAGLLG
jgi:hypothetical protein